ncbi:MAG TPA: hypothetical protein VFQ43_15725 [Nitrososphaera sp.]|nr:hypothetical protein [Nitrososphaera sp.]
MTRIKTRLIQGAVLGILGLAWAVLGAMPGFAAGVGNQCDGKFLFKMNIIGVDKGKNPPMNNTSRKTIFVKLQGQSDILLTQGEFSVCDGNSWDQAYDCNGIAIGNLTGAVFQLPCNLNVPADITCVAGTTEACYDVYFRALGTPGGGVTITTCGELADGTMRVCSSENTGLISRNHGKPTFTKVTNQLTSIVALINGKIQRTALFTDAFQQFLWQYDNQGLRNGMVVFCGADCTP